MYNMHIYIYVQHRCVYHGFPSESCWQEGVYTLVLCVEMKMGKSAIYALLSQCRKCRDLRALRAENCESWDPSQKNRNSSPGCDAGFITLMNFPFHQPVD